jgi:hypothetical protein
MPTRAFKQWLATATHRPDSPTAATYLQIGGEDADILSAMKQLAGMLGYCRFPMTQRWWWARPIPRIFRSFSHPPWARALRASPTCAREDDRQAAAMSENIRNCQRHRSTYRQ